MLDLLLKKHSQAGLRMLFHNISPLGNQAQHHIFPKIPRRRRAICVAIAQQNERWIFHNPLQARLRRDLKIHSSLACPSIALRSSAFLFYPRISEPSVVKNCLSSLGCGSKNDFAAKNFAHSLFRMSHHPPDALLQPNLRLPPQLLPGLSVCQHYPWQ